MANNRDVAVNYTDSELARLYRLQVRELEDYAMFVTNRDGFITTWNRGVEKTFGYSEQEWLGQHASIIFTEEDRKAGIPDAEFKAANEHGRASDVRWHRRKDGKRVYMTGVLRVLRAGDGELIGFTKVFLDETHRKRLEDALTKSNADLLQFAFIASHDLQEPLRTITNFAELLERRSRGRLDAECGELLNTIIRSARQMSDLISDLLAYSQVSHEDSASGTVLLDEAIEAALSMLRSTIEESGAIITHDPLPELRIHRAQAARLFQNLISNAMKFRKPEELPVIHVSAEHAGREWVIRIHDNGVGFSPAQAEALFAPFKRLHGSKYPGSGIGLAACRRIVERFGGRIAAESEPGKGSTFWFTVPEVRPDDL
jgi:PAS domain S-box-containing protein